MTQTRSTGSSTASVASLPIAASTNPSLEIECPFRGLEVFDEDHAEFFFGREALTPHLVDQLREDRFLAVLGPSGSGKSSVVRAGLVPQVRRGVLPGQRALVRRRSCDPATTRWRPLRRASSG